MDMVTVKHAGAVIQLPHDVVVRNFIDSVMGHTPQQPAGSIPPIGQYWQGQGGIYAGLIRGEQGQPDRHVIVPAGPEAQLTDREWGKRGHEVVGADNYFYGMHNTVAMAESGSELAKDILAMEIDGHKDFYLPARHEARLCFINAKDLFDEAWYWTSTQSSAGYAFYQGFTAGSQNYGYKLHQLLARPVRSFVSHSVI